jgi:mRNA-degrading endonuclease toxin of MazEF toxin-antitoxin module
MKYQRGDVLWADDPYRSGSNPRPWVLISNNSLPYANTEYIALILTRQSHPGSRQLTPSDWEYGQPPQTSYISPWTVGTIKHDQTQNIQGRLTTSVVDEVVTELESYIEAESGP